MEEPKPNGQAVSFGVFELDLKAGELRRNGFKVRLQEQPFQTRRLLVEGTESPAAPSSQWSGVFTSVATSRPKRVKCFRFQV